jgi:hypothetical protein
MRDKLKKLIREWNDEPRTQQRSDTAHEAWAFGHAARELVDAMKPQWVPVSERLPDEYLEVFTFCNNETHVGFMQDGRWVRADGFIMRNVTHWHEIDEPQPPESHP